jgi:hypothetical protein
MVEYITTGNETLDTTVGGYPVGELSVMKGSSDLNIQSWINLQATTNDTLVLSEIRPTPILGRLLDESVTYESGEISDTLDKYDISTFDVIIVESVDSVPVTNLATVADSYDIAVVVFNPSPSQELEYTASIVFEIKSYIVEKDNKEYRLILRKHSHKNNSIILTLYFKPEPQLDNSLKA